MNDYVALLRLDHLSLAASLQAAAHAIQTLSSALRGVREASFDPAAGMLTVRFDRSLTSVADVVRWFEDRGLRISGVAQSRADPGLSAVPA